MALSEIFILAKFPSYRVFLIIGFLVMNYTLSSLALSEILNFSSEQKFTEVLFILFIEFPSLVASQANFLYKISEVLKTLEYPNFLFLKWGLSKNKGFLKYILIYFVTSNLIYLFL